MIAFSSYTNRVSRDNGAIIRSLASLDPFSSAARMTTRRPCVFSALCVLYKKQAPRIALPPPHTQSIQKYLTWIIAN